MRLQPAIALDDFQTAGFGACLVLAGRPVRRVARAAGRRRPPGRDAVTHNPDLIVAGCLAVGLLIAALHPPTRRRWLAAYLRSEP